MKKIICVLLVVMMLMGTTFAEEEFTLHNGTKFGMTSEEVVSLEKKNGVSVENDVWFWFWSDNNIQMALEKEYDEVNDSLYEEYMKEHEDELTCKRYAAKTTVANIPNASISYDFYNNALFHMRYSFVNYESAFEADEFITIEQGLTNKYGATEYSSTAGVFMPSMDIYHDERSNEMNPIPATTEGNWERDLYSHRLIPQNDESYVFIDHYVTHYSGDSQYYHYLDYYLLSNEEAQAFISAASQVDSDL